MENHFKVVRYFNDWGVGVIEQVLGSGLTFEEAERIADSQAPTSSAERIMIQDEDATGLDDIVRIDTVKDAET